MNKIKNKIINKNKKKKWLLDSISKFFNINQANSSHLKSFRELNINYHIQDYLLLNMLHYYKMSKISTFKTFIDYKKEYKVLKDRFKKEKYLKRYYDFQKEANNNEI